MRAYQYHKLQVETQEIRLLVLQPGKFADDICFTILHRPLVPPLKDETPAKQLSVEELRKTLPEGWTVDETLDGRYLFIHDSLRSSWSHVDPNFDRELYELPEPQRPTLEPNYEALSYTWGSVKNPVAARVLSTGKSGEAYETFQIGQNLACALRHLRFTDRPRMLWVDAVCINQQDIDERNAQVKRMGNVYALAARTIVWLGQEDDNSKRAQAVLQYLSEQVEFTVDTFAADSPDAMEPEWFLGSCPLPYDGNTWLALVAFFQRSWFSRVWVVQEVQLANRYAVAQCGDTLISWHVLQKAILLLYEKRNIPQMLSLILTRIMPIARILKSGTTIDSLLEGGRNLQCSDPRDRVYGMLSLAPPLFASRIQPRYSLPLSEVYKDAFLVNLGLSQRMDQLLYCRLVGCLDNWPSWLPNWGLNSPDFTRFTHGSASRISAAHAQYIHPRTLEVIGKECATVISVGKMAHGTNDEVVEIIRKSEPKILLAQYMKSDETRLDAYVDVLHLGNLKERRPHSSVASMEEAREEYLALISKSNPTDNRQATTYLELEALMSKSIITTHEGHIGLAVPEVELGKSSFVSLE